MLDFAAFTVIITISLIFLLHPDKANALEPISMYFGEETNISNNYGTSELAQVTSEGNNVYVVWQDNSSGNYDIYFAHSPDNGKNFESIKNLSKNNGTSELAQVTSEGNNVYVVWQDNSSGNYDIYFAHSPDNGKNFESIKNLSKNNGTSELAQVTSEGNNVYVVWQDNSSGNYDIYFAHSPDNGKNFESIKNLSKNNGTSELAQVTSEGNNVYVVWQDNSSGNYDIYFAHSPDNGKNFESIKNLSKNNGTSELAQVTSEGNNVYVVWQDNSSGNYDIYFKASASDGTKFKSTRNLSKNNSTSQYPRIASFNGVFHVVWNDDSNEKQDIFSKDGRIENLSKSIEYGSLRKLQSIGDASNPEIFAGENFVPTVWSSTSELSSVINIYPVSFFDDSKDAIQLSKSGSNGNILNVKIFGNNTIAYCVWENKDILKGDIFFKRFSTDFFE